MGKTLLGYRKLFDTLKKGNVHPLYFLYGPEEYLKKEFVRGLIEAALPGENRAFNLDILYGEEFDRTLLDDRIHSFPLFTDRRVVILKNFDGLSTANKDYVIDSAEGVSESVVFVIESAREKLDSARLKRLKKVADRRGIAASFALLDDQETVERVMQRLRREGYEIEPEALDLLLESVGTRLIDLGNEVDKILLAAGERKTIDRGLVGEVVGKYRTENLFSLLDAVGHPDPSVVLRKTLALIDGGEEPVFVLAMLQKRAVLLLQVGAILREKGRAASGGALAGLMGGAVSPYYAEILRRQCSRLQPEAIERLLSNLRWADVKLKTTRLDPKSVLEEAILASHLGKTLAPGAAKA
jgi:DNA polymerase-3 subunit delta